MKLYLPTRRYFWYGLLGMAVAAGLVIGFSAQAQTRTQTQSADEVPLIAGPDNVPSETMAAVDVKRGAHVPARVDGLWCAVGLLKGASFRLTQKYQTFEGVLAWRDRTRYVSGTIKGTELRVPAGNSGELVLQAVGETMRITSAQGGMALAQGQTFTRAVGATCS